MTERSVVVSLYENIIFLYRSLSPHFLHRLEARFYRALCLVVKVYHACTRQGEERKSSIRMPFFAVVHLFFLLSDAASLAVGTILAWHTASFFRIIILCREIAASTKNQ